MRRSAAAAPSERRRRALEQEGVAVLDDYREALMRGSAAEGPDATLARERNPQACSSMRSRTARNLPLGVRAARDRRPQQRGNRRDPRHSRRDGEDPPVIRSRRRLQEMLAPELKTALSGTFPFAGSDCAALTERVLAALSL